MRRKAVVILALVLVFALMFTGCATRRPLQTPVQPRQNTTGLYDNNRGIGTATGTTTGTGTATNRYTGMGTTNTPYGTGYGTANNAGYNGYGGNIGYGGYGGAGTPYYNSGYGNNYRNIGGTNNYPNYGAGTATTESDRLARSCESVSGVNNANVVVSGNTAYVGVDTAGDNTGRNVAYGAPNNVSTIKSQCAQQVRAANPQIQNVYVSTDANFMNRLRRVGEGVKNGTAVSSFRDELDALVRGLTPEKL